MRNFQDEKQQELSPFLKNRLASPGPIYQLPQNGETATSRKFNFAFNKNSFLAKWRS
jgi:hypothetical protein